MPDTPALVDILKPHFCFLFGRYCLNYVDLKKVTLRQKLIAYVYIELLTFICYQLLMGTFELFLEIYLNFCFSTASNEQHYVEVKKLFNFFKSISCQRICNTLKFKTLHPCHSVFWNTNYNKVSINYLLISNSLELL